MKPIGQQQFARVCQGGGAGLEAMRKFLSSMKCRLVNSNHEDGHEPQQKGRIGFDFT